MRAGTKRRIGLFLRALRLGVVIGAVSGSVTGHVFLDAGLLSALLSALSGVIGVGTLTAVIAGAEIFLPQTRLGHAIERAPFLVTFAVKWLAYGTIIVLVFEARLGLRLVGAVLRSADLAPAFLQALQAGKSIPPSLSIMFVCLLMPAFILVLQLSRLVGERTLRDIVRGRYHQPHTEERFFLFVDLAGSTPLAERLGPAAVHRFLGGVFRIASTPIDDHGGEVYQYVGDEIVITWTVSEGRPRARPLACFFAIAQALAQAAPAFERDFGTMPHLRAALHAGPVITGEVGESRRAIVFHGDVMNTASRLEGATRDLERQFLVSGDALEHLEGLEGYAVEDLGLQRLRGRDAAVPVYAVTAQPKN
jgi:adenylate cyclase